MTDHEESFLYKLYKHATEDDDRLLDEYYRFGRKDAAKLIISFFAACFVCTAIIIIAMGYSFYLGFAMLIAACFIVVVVAVWVKNMKFY